MNIPANSHLVNRRSFFCIRLLPGPGRAGALLMCISYLRSDNIILEFTLYDTG